MARIFDGEVSVSYSQAYVRGDERAVEDLLACFAGQSNGLCGAASPGILFLVTGLHTGTVPVTVERSDAAPPVGEEWEEVVEVSFHTDRRTVLLQGWAGESSAGLDLGEPGDYRVRYCARGMDAGREQDTPVDDEPAADAYQLQFWPAPPADDVVVTQTSEVAAYWHDNARSLPPPRTVPQDREAAQQRSREENLRRQREDAIATSWSGRAPSARLREVAVVVGSLGQTDRDLLDELAALDPNAQRDAARWVARRASEVTGVDTPDPDLAGDPLVALLDALHHAGAAFDERRPELIAELRARYLPPADTTR